jgi:hypothetical protein
MIEFAYRGQALNTAVGLQDNGIKGKKDVDDVAER